MSVIRKCRICGKEIVQEGKGYPKQFCSEECKKKANAQRLIAYNKQRRDERKAKKEMGKIKHKGRLDETLAECRKRKISYADRQKEETLRLIREGKL